MPMRERWEGAEGVTKNINGCAFRDNNGLMFPKPSEWRAITYPGVQWAAPTKPMHLEEFIAWCNEQFAPFGAEVVIADGGKSLEIREVIGKEQKYGGH